MQCEANKFICSVVALVLCSCSERADRGMAPLVPGLLIQRAVKDR